MDKLKRKISAFSPSASLADTGFIFLVFFLVTATTNVYAGVRSVSLETNPIERPVKDRDILKVFINAEGDILVDESEIPIEDLRSTVKSFIDNHGENPEWSTSPKTAVISIKVGEGTVYQAYIDILDEIKGAYSDLRNRRSMEVYGRSYRELSNTEKQPVNDYYPVRISESEPDFGL